MVRTLSDFGPRHHHAVLIFSSARRHGLRRRGTEGGPRLRRTASNADGGQAEIRLYSPNRTTRIRRRRTGRPRELKNDVYTNTNCENDSSIRPTICRVLARPRMPPAFHLLPRLPNPARPAAEYDARAFGHRGLTVLRKPLTKPQLQNFSRTQEAHPLWVHKMYYLLSLVRRVDIH